jgi:Fe-S-cluster containining protein
MDNNTVNSKDKKHICRMCGECCFREVPVTILDISRIAKLKNNRIEDIFREIIDVELSERLALFVLKKKKSGTCVFLDDENKCSIHDNKPNVCRFYNCSPEKDRNELIFSWDCSQEAQRNKLREQIIARQETKTYIRKNGIRFLKDDFLEALDNIASKLDVYKKLNTNFVEDVKEGSQIALLDCEHCRKPGLCAQETPVSLRDIAIISRYLNISPGKFFDKYIATQKSKITGGFQLKHYDHCIFFNQLKQECSVRDVAPLFCYLTPCPRIISNASEISSIRKDLIDKKHQYFIAMKITLEYVARQGLKFNKNRMKNLLLQTNRIIGN